MQFREYLTETTAECNNYRSDSNSCITGCKKNKVMKGNSCPFDGRPEKEKNGYECKCYE